MRKETTCASTAHRFILGLFDARKVLHLVRNQALHVYSEMTVGCRELTKELKAIIQEPNESIDACFDQPGEERLFARQQCRVVETSPYRG